MWGGMSGEGVLHGREQTCISISVCAVFVCLFNDAPLCLWLCLGVCVSLYLTGYKSVCDLFSACLCFVTALIYGSVSSWASGCNQERASMGGGVVYQRTSGCQNTPKLETSETQSLPPLAPAPTHHLL